MRLFRALVARARWLRRLCPRHGRACLIRARRLGCQWVAPTHTAHAHARAHAQVTNAALAGIYCFALPVVLLVVGGALAAGVAGRSVAAAKSALVAEVREDLLATARAGLAAAATADFGAPFESKRSGGVVVTVTNGDRERAVRTAVMVAWTPDRVGRLSHATRFLAPGGGGGGAGSGGGHSAACTSLVTTALMSAIVARALAAGGSGSGPGAGDAERVVEGALEAAAGASDEALHGEAWACCEGRGHGRLASTRLWTGLWCLLLSLALALFVTGVTKNWFGAPRPSFFYWNNFKGYAAVYGGVGGGAAPCSLDFLSGTLRSPLPGALRAYLAATNASALVPSAIAALYAPGTDACLDSLRAFPSGHASLSMACMGFAAAWTWALALRLTSMAVVHEHRHGAALVTGARAAAIAVCLLYVLLSLNVARTRCVSCICVRCAYVRLDAVRGGSALVLS
jgi:membrane-associated phospholipid phosphatase